MAKIKLTKEPCEVYFKKSTNYELEINGKPLTIVTEEDNNGSDIHFLHEDGSWLNKVPEWILELCDYDTFETTVWEHLHGMSVNEEIYTHKVDEL